MHFDKFKISYISKCILAIDKCFKGVKSAKDVSVSHFSASLTKQRIGNATNMKKIYYFD